AEIGQSANRVREQGSELRDRSPGFLRSRSQNDLYLLPTRGPRLRDGYRPRDAQRHESLAGAWDLQRSRRYISGWQIHLRRGGPPGADAWRKARLRQYRHLEAAPG